MRDASGGLLYGASRPICKADIYKTNASCSGRQQTGANLSIKIENLPNYFDLSLIWSIFASVLAVCNTYNKVLRPKARGSPPCVEGARPMWLNIYQFKLLILKFHSIYVVM